MISVHIFSRIKNIFITILAILRRGLCCLSRKRKPSYSDCEVLTSVNVDTVQTNSYSSKQRDGGERDWNSWDDSPRTVDEHIEQYRNRLAQSKQIGVENAEPAVDFFGDMEPRVLKQKKLFVDTGKKVDNFSRLQATGAAAIPHIQTAELEDWSDNENDNNENGPAGWDGIDDETTRQLIREKKREIRAQRQQQQRAKHQHQRH